MSAQLANTKPTAFTDAEWAIRCDLAAAYRLIAKFGMDDLIFTHLSMRLPGEGDRFLINPYGWMFDEITASSLVEVDAEGLPAKGESATVNPAGFVIHSAVHRARHDAQCVMHTHTLAGMTIAALDGGLLPVNQMSMEFYGDRVAYHPYEGIADDLSERERIVADLGDRNSMILANHGLLTVGRTVAEAFYYMYYLEQACRIQVAAMSTGAKLTLPSPEVCQYVVGQFSRGPTKGQRPWAALRRKLDRECPDYAS